MERFNPRKLNELQSKKQYQINIPKRCAALENLNDSQNINRARETLKRISKPLIDPSSVRIEAK